MINFCKECKDNTGKPVSLVPCETAGCHFTYICPRCEREFRQRKRVAKFFSGWQCTECIAAKKPLSTLRILGRKAL